jgi:hypothetical protein
MSTDREQWIRERGEKLFDELYDIHFISVSPRPNALLAISECLKEVGALSPPQAVDEKGIREAAEAYANNCLDITTTTWEWIVDAYEAGASRSVKGGNNQNES